MRGIAGPDYRRPLDVVHVVSSLKEGGMERLVLGLAARQAGAGHRVRVLALRGGPLLGLAPAVPFEVRILEGWSGAWRWARAVAYLARRDVDVVHGHNLTSLRYTAAAKVVTRAKVVVTAHGPWGGVTRPPRWWELAPVDAFVSVSGDVADRHRSLFGPGSRVKKYVVIRNGVDFDPPRRSRAEVLGELALPPGVTGVVTARLEPAKDHETLLRAVDLLRRRGTAVNLLIAGEGSERPRLEALAGGLGLDPRRVRFLGFRSDVPDLLAAADFFALSSVAEGLPLALLEAMTHHLPVVVTRVGGVPEVVTDGEHGFLVPQRAVGPLAAAIEKLAQDPQLRRDLGRAGFRRVGQEFTVEQMVQRYDTLYRSLLGGVSAAAGDKETRRQGVVFSGRKPTSNHPTT